MLELVKIIVINTFHAVKRIPRSYLIPIGFALLGLCLFIYGLFSYLSSSKGSEDLSLPDVKAQISPVKTIKNIFIDIEGAVIKPGVYAMAENSRVQDALIASGGFSADSDRIWVEKNINLAAKVTDAMKIYIPRIGENQNTGSQSNTVLGSNTNSSLININSATEAQIESLPGVGPVTAQKIISGRPYTSLNDLIDHRLISKSTFEKIKDKISL